ncbi:NAD(+) synthase [Caulobacter vibrioides]|uniref:Glutamine-dependent NAD(+) synthetase n=3 Tax=Caulobacter vibrioides TaxID=155892 RepID=Q9A2E6_CAUVC|nr:NAD(+) synthase [Caulobacter vibrioides]YP_002519107.1 glutamine-dependent NAD synthetase [Caulobacter vibrioides NA1000]QBQ57441.1 NAD(+) synthase [synthetic Caulobacter sp. 'ethensis']AAK25581.1 NAD(+) synthetase, putative [Caulobacter vibrioides CB15]ACL97199.1 glutamine-dependent NAD synthetase [Caulobacter vibrioides NA1000]ATC30422.1 NAD(+) synthase [Caulobacter vibrioides]QXZ51955.1 NAD(+) synthase [Caulobacter vibrioides]
MGSPSFFSPYRHGFVRVATAVPKVKLADPAANAQNVVALAREAHAEGVAVVVFPELGLTGYTIDDLLQQEALLDAVEAAIATLTEASAGLAPMIVVGGPLRDAGRLYNTAIVIQGGKVLGVVPKSFLPNYREFYERRWFTPGAGLTGKTLTLAGQTVPFGTDILFRGEGVAPFTVGVEICEDVWTPTPPSTAQALAGAEILLNLSASNITIGKSETRRLLCASQSSRMIAAYVYSAAGAGESSTDLAWDGHVDIHEMGALLAETPRFSTGPAWTFADVDVQRLRQERMRVGSFGDAMALSPASTPFRIVPFAFDAPEGDLALARPIERFPFTPSDPARLRENCYEAYNIQVQGLARRLEASGLKKLVIGISGGLDSTQALLVAAKAMDQLGLPRSNILAYTLPGFATSDRTKSNAWALMKAMAVTAAELDIRPAATQMLKDLDHPFGRGEAVYDVTFENVQAGLRTDYLFRLANHNAALVVGTGDLSELALGWCTYGVGDHMSHYNPNCGAPKTLIQHLIRFVAHSGDVGAETTALLDDILATEISPELVPGEAVQATESFVGPYALQDFNLYYMTRYGMAPSKIAFLAWSAWHDADQGGWPVGLPDNARRAYDLPEIKRWLELFLKRFFANQFKRSAVPNGPKISSGGALSPRGDWRMPSDATADAWLAELRTNAPI